MLRLTKSKKAQAAVELAIIGSLIIMAFSYLILFTAKINMKLEHVQNVFRSLLKGVGDAGQSHADPVAYRRLPNILSPYEPGTLTPFKASGKILWSSGEARGDNDITAEWSKDKSYEHITYHKTFRRKEDYGHYPQTERKVEWWTKPNEQGEKLKYYRQGP